MKMFTWKSKAMGNYYNGEVIVMAPSLKSAKAKVLRHAQKKFKGWNEAGRMSRLKDDLKSEPTTDEVVFISGGE